MAAGMGAARILREDVRNRLLRRADWRFLLPNPSPARSVCYADGTLAEAVRLISDRTINPRREGPNGCDLAVAVDPDPATLRSAWAALRPGGSCYTQWSLLRAGGSRRVRRRLEAAGFVDASCYWPRPRRALPEIWLPLEAPGALQYFLTNRPRPRNLMRRIGRGVRRIRWLLSPRFRLTRPICAVAHKPVGSLDRECEPSLAETIRAGWERWGFGPTPARLSWLLVTGGARSESKAVALVFAEPDPRPRLAVKMSRTPEARPGLTREVANLRALQARPGGVRGAPTVLFTRLLGNGLAVGETAVTGLFLSSVLTRETYRELALKGTEWLADLAGPAGLRPPEASPRSLIGSVLADFEASFGVVADAAMVRETAEILGTLGPLPRVCEQRDFAPWNVLVAATGELGVLDWESSELEGLPAMDLVYFQAYLAFALRKRRRPGAPRNAYREMLGPSSLTGAVARECFERYGRRLGLRLETLRPLRLLVWLLHSRSEYRRFVADVAGTPGPEVLRRSLFLALWEEELRHGARS